MWACGLSSSSAHGIFPDQGSNPCLLHWQADSLPLSHQGSPSSYPSESLPPSFLEMLRTQVIASPQQRFLERAPVSLSCHIRWFIWIFPLFFPFFKYVNMIQTMVKCTKDPCVSLSDLGVVRLWFSKQWNPSAPLLVFFLFSDVYIQRIRRIELNARRAPCCAVRVHPPPSPWPQSFKLFNFGNDISLQFFQDSNLCQSSENSLCQSQCQWNLNFYWLWGERAISLTLLSSTFHYHTEKFPSQGIFLVVADLI